MASPSLSHRIAVLVFLENTTRQQLLMLRAKPPNLGVWSPIGGKLETAQGESPFECAARETFEETGLMLAAPGNPPGRMVRPEWRGFHERGLAPALDKLDYIYRAVTPPGSPRRFNARFFMAFANDLHGEIAGNGELHDIAWVPITEALKMPIPHITGVVLREIERLLHDPAPRDEVDATPFFRRVGKKYILKME